MVDEIATDCVVNSAHESNLQLSTDAVSGSNQHRLLQLRESAVKHSAEATYFRERPLIECAPGQLFNPVGRTCRRINVDTGVAVSYGLSHL
jgi:hypothetical protein